MLKRLLLTLAIVAASTLPALAHPHPIEHGGSFVTGFTHPLFGLDHVLAMVAVGLWAALQGGRAIWMVPAAFVGTMALGFVAAIAGVPLPLVEPVILVSVIFIGIAIALALPIPTPAVAALVGFFALFHGHAHGSELGGAGALEFATGFVLATIMLHGVGIVLGLLVGRFGGAVVSRIAGGLTALGGLYLAFAA